VLDGISGRDTANAHVGSDAHQVAEIRQSAAAILQPRRDILLALVVLLLLEIKGVLTGLVLKLGGVICCIGLSVCSALGAAGCNRSTAD
jgi:hypothetical protein